ncbi:MAG: enoyl-CoA hydratase-related protein, partial [Nannocystaceae bacterium]
VDAIFFGNQGTRALLVAGCCGNVGFGKLGQLARLLVRHGVPVIALDLSPAVQEIPARLTKAYGSRFKPEQVQAILDNITVVQGTLDDIPSELGIGFVFEAIPERLDLKRSFYSALRARDPEAYIFSATSGLTTKKLFGELPQNDRCGVLHPFFPHLTNKLWEFPTKDAVTSAETSKLIGKLLGSLGMNVIRVADVPSFAADRLFCGMMLEAVRTHVDLGLSPAQVDDVCKRVLGTSPFFVHNLIRGANGLSAHCMQLMREEADSTIYAIPDAWQPYIADPDKKWPYERGSRCPPEKFDAARTRILGMIFSLTSYMVEHNIADLDAINHLAEKALAFRQGPPAQIEELGFDAARELITRFAKEQALTLAEVVAPVGPLTVERATRENGWQRVYVDTSIHNGIGLISLKRTTINHTFIAELDAAYELLQNDPAVSAMVIAPDGAYSREFGHGADLQCFVPVLGNHDAALGLIQTWKKTLLKLRRGKPTVAALVGRVLGGGLEFASSCHARIAASGTRLGQPEPTVGVLPGLGGCHQIHRASNPDAHAKISELLLTGHTFQAELAHEWGFVSRIVPVAELPRASMAYAAELAASGTLPSFRLEAAQVPVTQDVNPCNEQGVVLDAELRGLIARTIADANATSFAEGSALEEVRAAESLCLSSSKIGVKAMMRGKPPAFEHPLVNPAS